MASLLFSLKVKESYTQTLPVTCFLVNVCLLLLSFFLLSADVWFPLNQSSSLKKTWILMTPISVKFHFLGLPLSKPRNSQRKKWRTFDSLSIVVVFFIFSRPTQDLEICAISALESPNTKMNFASFSGLSWIHLRLVVGDCRANQALLLSIAWICSSFMIMEKQVIYSLKTSFYGDQWIQNKRMAKKDRRDRQLSTIRPEGR